MIIYETLRISIISHKNKMKKIYQITLCLLLSYTAFSQTISSNAPLCGNQNLTLELAATGGSTYAWKGPNGFASTQQKPTLKNVNWKNRGVYTVLVDNKTTLTTDVNIKDPLVFTVPKEISVCEGGSFIIEPKMSKLTDSTANDAQYSFDNPSGKRVFDYYFKVQNFSAKDAGTYKVNGYSYLGCSTTQEIKVSLNTNKDCKSIEIEDLSKVKMCYGQEVSIPFTAKGGFKIGTKFKVYVHNGSNTSPTSESPTLIVDKSPIIIKNLNNFYNQSFRILIVADDIEKTVGVSNDRQISDPYSNNGYYQKGFSSSISCDSAKIGILLFEYMNSLQWFQDGKAILGANTPNLSVKNSGVFTMKFKKNFHVYDTDKSCLYETDPFKIELGKIEKPSAYVSNDVELCVGKPATLTVSTNLNTNYRWKKDGVLIANATKPTFETLQEGKYQVEAKEGTCTAVSDTVVLKKSGRLDEIYSDIRGESSNAQTIYKFCDNPNFYFVLDRVPQDARHQVFKDKNVVLDVVGRQNINFKRFNEEGNYFIKTTYGECTGISRTYSVVFDKTINIYKSNKLVEVCDKNTSTIIGFTSPQVVLDNYSLFIGSLYKDGKIINDWKIDPTKSNLNLTVNQSGNYYGIGKITFKDGNECTVTTDTTKISFVKKQQDINSNFDSKINAVPITTCKDTAQILGNNYIGTAGREVSYKWTKDGVILKQDSSSTLQATQAGNYQLETTYKGGCTVVSSPYKVEFGKINIGFRNVSASICPDDSYYLFSNHSLLDYDINNNYELYKDGQIFLRNINNPALRNGLIGLITQAGTYKLTVKNGKCEGTSPDFMLKVDKIPTTISPTDSVVYCGNKTVDLKVSTEAGLSYIWERNGSVIGQANQPTLSASTDGLYRATLLRGACWGSTPSIKLKSLPNIIPTATLTGDQKIDYDKETKLSINLSSYAPWTFKLSDGKEYTATKSPFEIAVKPLSTMTYSLSEVKNICGTGTVSGTAKIEIIILSTEEEKELHVEVFPVPSSEICNWKIQTPEITTASVVLYDVSGNTQYTHTPNTRSQSHEGIIDLSTLKAGTYFLKLQAGEKSVIRKVVKF